MLNATLLATALILAPVAETEDSTTGHPFDRVAVIGASVSDGFLLPLEVDAMITLADTLAAASRKEMRPPFRRSSALFFRDPVGYGRRYAEAAKEYDPTLLVALDYLFWFGYGFAADEEDRMRRLERGLASLETFECPILVGTFPDVRVAAEEGVGIHDAPMIAPWQVPEPVTLVKLNIRLRSWASKRENVVVVPMAEFLEKIREGEPITIRDSSWSGPGLGKLLDKDLLHTTMDGTVALTLLALDTLVKADVGVGADEIRWDRADVRARVLDARRVERRQRGAVLVETGAKTEGGR